MRTLLRSFIISLFLLCSTLAVAGDLTLFVGGAKPGELNSDDLRTALDSSPIFGLRLSSDFVPHFGMEHTVAISTDYLFPRDLADITSAKGFVYSSNLIINIPVKKFVPYLTAGAGIIHQYGSDDLPVGTKFAFNYGGGLKLPKLAGPLGLRFDARGYTAAGVFSSRLNILEVSAGLLIGF